MKILQCQQVTRSFGERAVLDHVSLEVEQGQFFGLVGLNGHGKSTLIKAVLDLISIDAGVIEIMGMPHRNVHSRDEVAYLPDRFSPPLHLRCKDFLQYILELHGSDKSEDEILTVLRSLDLREDIMMMSVGKLSKGMTQKLGLASCLLSDKKFLVLDEPMSGLDPKSRVLLKQCLENKRKQGVSLFFSSHVLADVEELSDTMAVLHDSRILYSGSCEDFVARNRGDNLEDAYMKSIADS